MTTNFLTSSSYRDTTRKRKAVTAADFATLRNTDNMDPGQEKKEPVERKYDDGSPLPPPYPRASLLGLPAELLNRIYREVLVCNFKISILAVNKPQYPSLITTCRKTYRESRLIYLEENKFSLYSYDYKMPMPRQPTSHWIWHSEATRFVVYQGSLNWTNLMAWVKLWYEDRALRALESSLQGGRLMPKLASRVFSIVEAMEDVEWITVERVLEEVKMGLEDAGVAFGYL
ncbi:hypothetical protein AC579_2644 [Pseudocercospora musae]|uniref:F-box domain-containing protein n=1 Tax=Pseudocercospora musae TaxID=113226 RepID=A0A139IH49_9PEZI|nr:hypothetical protein AC579_2644 [Pseudocercospora musae]